MQEACQLLNKNCIARKRHLKFRNEWTIYNLTMGKAGCYRKKKETGEIWITCQKCYNYICDLNFVRKVYGCDDMILGNTHKCPVYDKNSPDSGLCDIHLVTRDKFDELSKKYGHTSILCFELYLASKPENDHNGK